MKIAYFLVLIFISCLAFDIQAEEKSSEITFYVGGLSGDSFAFQPSSLFTEVQAVLEDDITGGFRYAYYFHPRLAAEFGVGFSPSSILAELNVSGGSDAATVFSIDTYVLHANVLVPFLTQKVNPYVTAGVAAVHFRLNTIRFGFVTPSETDFALNAGGGIKFGVKEDISLRFDGRAYWIDPEFARESDRGAITEFTGGVSILFNF